MRLLAALALPSRLAQSARQRFAERFGRTAWLWTSASANVSPSWNKLRDGYPVCLDRRHAAAIASARSFHGMPNAVNVS